MRGIKQLAAAILYKAFDDLADPEQTQYIYASFFDSDYAKKLFDLAGVAYNKNVINARIAQRPPVDKELYDAGTYTFYHIPECGGSFTICVDAGYITRIERGGKLYRLERNSVRYDDDCSYIADVAIPKIKYGTYKIVEGVRTMMRDADILNNLRLLLGKAERSEKGLIMIETEKAECIFGDAIAALERASDAEKKANEKILKLVELLVKE